MIKDIIICLEEIEKSAKGGADAAKIKKDIQSAKAKLMSVGAPLVGAQNGRAQGPPLRQLNDELSVWEEKLDVILRERAGREGMAKHAKHLTQELRKMNV